MSKLMSYDHAIWSFCFVMVWVIAYLVIRKCKYFLGSEELSRLYFQSNGDISLYYLWICVAENQNTTCLC